MNLNIKWIKIFLISQYSIPNSPLILGLAFFPGLDDSISDGRFVGLCCFFDCLDESVFDGRFVALCLSERFFTKFFFFHIVPFISLTFVAYVLI